MIKVIKPHTVIRQSPVAFIIGIVLGVVVLLSIGPISDTNAAIKDYFFPVIKDWTVTEAEILPNGSLQLRGTMIKQRACAHRPPNLARDDTGRNYTVMSLSPTIGISYPASPIPFTWGPWVIEGAANKRIDIFAIYECAPKRNPVVVRLGQFDPLKWATR